jgi:histone chaperone ASF1
VFLETEEHTTRTPSLDTVFVMQPRVKFVGAKLTSPNPSPFGTPFTLQIVLEVLDAVPKHPLDVIFTWSPVWDFDVDQTLDELEVGPLTLGVNTLTMACDPPEVSKIPDPLGPTALLVSLQYQGSEFLHIGYHVSVQCLNGADPPEVFEDASLLVRTIGKGLPRLSTIPWDSAAGALDEATEDPAAAVDADEVEQSEDSWGEDEDEEEETAAAIVVENAAEEAASPACASTVAAGSQARKRAREMDDESTS